MFIKETQHQHNYLKQGGITSFKEIHKNKKFFILFMLGFENQVNMY